MVWGRKIICESKIPSINKHEHSLFFCLYQLRDAEGEATLQTALDAMNEQFVKLSEIDWMGPILAPEVPNPGKWETKGKSNASLMSASSITKCLSHLGQTRLKPRTPSRSLTWLAETQVLLPFRHTSRKLD